MNSAFNFSLNDGNYMVRPGVAHELASSNVVEAELFEFAPHFASVTAGTEEFPLTAMQSVCTAAAAFKGVFTTT